MPRNSSQSSVGTTTDVLVFPSLACDTVGSIETFRTPEKEYDSKTSRSQDSSMKKVKKTTLPDEVKSVLRLPAKLHEQVKSTVPLYQTTMKQAIIDGLRLWLAARNTSVHLVNSEEVTLTPDRKTLAELIASIEPIHRMSTRAAGALGELVESLRKEAVFASENRSDAVTYEQIGEEERGIVEGLSDDQEDAGIPGTGDTRDKGPGGADRKKRPMRKPA